MGSGLQYTDEELKKFYSRRDRYVHNKSSKFVVENTSRRPLKVYLTQEALQDETDYYEHFKNNGSNLHGTFLERLGLYYYLLSDSSFKCEFIDAQNILQDFTSPRWPFVIIFEVTGDTVIIYTIHLHKSQ